MKGFKRYERYKDSGVEWIGEIPEHWKTTRLKYLKKSPFMYGANESAELDNPNLPRFIRITDIDFNGNLKEETFKSLPLELAEPYLLEEGDILFARSGASVGKTFIYERKWGPACFAGYLIRFQTDESKAIPKFIYYFCQTSIYEDWIKENTIQSTIQNVSAEKYSSLILPVPPLNTQNIIVNYLDQKTAEIDSLIADKEKLIELLQEQRQAIITQAVTKGLDPNVPMKDSGVEWIGEIPEHWEVTKIKYVSRINHHALSEDCDDDFEIQYIDIGGVDSNGQIIEIKKMRFGDAPSRARRIVKDGDTIVSTVRTYLKAITWVEKADDNLICSTGFAVLSPTKLINPQYLLFLMRSTQYIDEIVSRSVGVSYPAINSRDIGKIECLLPPYKEQKYIVDYINKKGKPLTDLIDCINEQILKLKEYRQSLITAAVTGKIDVRDYFNEGEEKEEQEEVS